MVAVVQYRQTPDGWRGECGEPQWAGAAATLDELRELASYGLRFAATGGRTSEPPARSRFFVHRRAQVEQAASERFVLI
jgi:hypothetical protein